MNERSQSNPLSSLLRDQIIGLDEHALRKSYYPQLQQQLDALKTAKASLELKAAELDAMRSRAEESEANYRELFDKSSEAIVVHDPSSKVVYEVNQAFLDLYGYSRAEVAGLSIAQLSSPEWQVDHQGIAEAIGYAMQQGTYRFEWLARRKEGTDFWADVTLKSTLVRGEPRILATIRDITARKQAEAALAEANRLLEEKVVSRTQDLAEANQELATLLVNLQATQKQLVQSEKLASLGTLVAGLAHELNTPIGNCVMVASTLQDQRTQFEKRLQEGLRKSCLNEFIENMALGCDALMRNLYRAADLISSFKELAVDQASSRRRLFGLHEVVHEVEIAHGPALRRAQCSLHSEIPPEIELDSFPGPLGQVMGNLIENAIQHGFEGRVGGEIHISAQLQGANEVMFVFRDNGQGIPEENLSRIFDPFFTTKMGQGGSGLGLHIAYSIVVGVLGGAIQVHSQLEQGTVFQISLPLVAPLH